MEMMVMLLAKEDLKQHKTVLFLDDDDAKMFIFSRLATCFLILLLVSLFIAT